MVYLLIVSFVWALSFGLIKNQLAGLDSTLVSAVRVALAALVFLPFLRLKHVRGSGVVKLILIGSVQFGAMYLLYLHAFKFLKSYEVALFTTTTPLYIILFDAALRRKFVAQHWAAATLAVFGTAVIVWHGVASSNLTFGLILVQLSNICFAVGQLAYRRIRSSMTASPDYSVFACLYVGALIISLITAAMTSDWRTFHPTNSQWLVLLYLGILASGLCFFLWNRGATLVNTGTLAALNNAKVPLAILFSLVLFHESADVTRLTIGGGLLIAAVIIAERAEPQTSL